MAQESIRQRRQVTKPMLPYITQQTGGYNNMKDFEKLARLQPGDVILYG
jgi:hypothetical protein